MQQQNNIVPPIFPLIRQAPPPNTAVGILTSDGLPGDIIPIKEQGPNPLLWTERAEFMDRFQWTDSDAAGTVLAAFNVGRVMSPNTFPGGDRLCPPRLMAINSSTFFTYESKEFIFWAIKPPAVKGKLRVEYFPGYSIDTTDVIGTALATFPTDSLLRANTWELDFAKSDVHVVSITANNPLGYFPTTRNEDIERSPNSSGTYVPAGGAASQSFFNANMGTLRVSVQNAYSPGSIFPTNTWLQVFTKYTGLKFYVLNGFRSAQDTTIL